MKRIFTIDQYVRMKDYIARYRGNQKTISYLEKAKAQFKEKSVQEEFERTIQRHAETQTLLKVIIKNLYNIDLQ